MLSRAKKIAGLVAQSIASPAMILALPHDVHAALADLGPELIELNQRLEKLERDDDGEK